MALACWLIKRWMPAIRSFWPRHHIIIINQI
jgi:hypothetical protein